MKEKPLPYSKFCKTALWSVFPADKPAPQPPPGTGTGYHLVMQTDGNLCLYRQTPGAAVWINPETARNLAKDGRSLRLADSGTAGIDGIWGSGPSDGFGDIEFEKVEYLTDQAKISSLGPPRANVSAVAENSLDEEQSLSVALVYSKSISSSWKVSTSLKIGAKTSFKCGVPSLAEGKVEVSAEFTVGFEWNQTKTETEQITYTQTIRTAPKKKVIGRITWRESSIELPYRAVGKIKFNGYPEKLPVHVEGIYSGAASHDVHMSWKYYEGPTNTLSNLAPGSALELLGDDGWHKIER